MTTVSVGPGKQSMPTVPKTRRLANVTNKPPGPTILSTAGTVSVPKAIAAIAWAPPKAYKASTPAISAAAKMTSGMRPVLRSVGAQAMMDSTPATRAMTAAMSKDEGSGAVPAGTYTPTDASGRMICPSVPSCSSTCIQECAGWRQ